MSENQKRTLTDAELVCNIMLGFLSFPKFALVTDQAMYERLNIRFDVTKERVSEMLVIMAQQQIILQSGAQVPDSQEYNGYVNCVKETKFKESGAFWRLSVDTTMPPEIFLSHNHSVKLEKA